MITGNYIEKTRCLNISDLLLGKIVNIRLFGVCDRVRSMFASIIAECRVLVEARSKFSRSKSKRATDLDERPEVNVAPNQSFPRRGTEKTRPYGSGSADRVSNKGLAVTTITSGAGSHQR